MKINFKQFFIGLFREITGRYDKTLYLKRKEICDICPLNNRGVCSRNLWISSKYLERPTFYNRVMTYNILEYLGLKAKEVIKLYKITYIRGCGCILRVKQKSDSSCPAKFW